MSFQALKQRFTAGEIGKPEFIRAAFEHHTTLFAYTDALKQTDVREIRINDEGVSFVMGEEGIRLHAPPGEARVAPLEVLNFGRYEPAETRVMDLLCAQARQILDVGANIGWYSVRMASRLPETRIHAFEPLPTTYRYLQRNVAENGLGARVSTYNYGLSEDSGAFKFYIAPSSGTNASLKNVANAADAREVTGLALTLDQWVANTGVRPDFIKCDVEGAELLVFRGGRATLAASRPVVVAELLRKWSKPFGYHPNDMLQFFVDLGYVCFGIGDTGTRRMHEVTDETVETNYAFLHGEAHRELIDQLQQETP
ncbi:FkbM family methyltransferase [Aquabacterium sp. OR-4]|uniref:FkbM family methyltransferase n=1 Tax=Aquabacterium sp. OR-4 TaxID=2978127 RepID=UPI0021B488B5|nr:FkbM family methyltransferase [Aquabacterium sp. OR-4]MDT7834496.1 FkbM family methyltransferase [Aquabacterium sp. OR-4]